MTRQRCFSRLCFLRPVPRPLLGTSPSFFVKGDPLFEDVRAAARRHPIHDPLLENVQRDDGGQCLLRYARALPRILRLLRIPPVSTPLRPCSPLSSLTGRSPVQAACASSPAKRTLGPRDVSRVHAPPLSPCAHQSMTFRYPARHVIHPSALCAALAASHPKLAAPLAVVRNWSFSAFYLFAELWGSVVLSVLFWGQARRMGHTRSQKVTEITLCSAAGSIRRAGLSR